MLIIIKYKGSVDCTKHRQRISSTLEQALHCWKFVTTQIPFCFWKEFTRTHSLLVTHVVQPKNLSSTYTFFAFYFTLHDDLQYWKFPLTYSTHTTFLSFIVLLICLLFPILLKVSWLVIWSIQGILNPPLKKHISKASSLLMIHVFNVQ